MEDKTAADDDAHLDEARRHFPALFDQDPPARFQRTFDRLRELQEFQFYANLTPFHSSYDSWNYFGRRKPSVRTPASPNEQSESSRSSRPSSLRTLSDWNSSATEDGKKEAQKDHWVFARVSTSALRLEREFKVFRTISNKSDPECKRFLRPLHFARLSARQPGDQLLSVAIYEALGQNYLHKVVELGPNFFKGDPESPVQETQRLESIPLLTFLNFAVKACEVLEILHHDNETIHGEIRPDAFHYNRELDLVRLTNFGSGARSFEHGLTSAGWSSLMSERGVEHKLQFIAPEQTGRLPAPPDTRTDIYSLGILLWTMLTGRTAFEGKTPLDIMQSVLSRRITLVSIIRPDVPDALCGILQHMTAKAMDDRYNSISGVKHDLSRLKTILTNGEQEALAAFKIGAQDISSFFSLPAYLVGRDNQRQMVLAILERASKRFSKLAPISRKTLYSLSSGSSMASTDRPDFSILEETLSDSTSSRSVGVDTSDRDRDRDSRLNSIPEVASYDNNNSFGGTQSRDESDLKHMDTLSSGSRNSLYTEGPTRSSSVLPTGSDSSTFLRTAQKLKRKGRTELIAICGSTGLGKSSLVQTIAPAARRLGYYSSAKFDQVQKAPFEPILRVMSSLFRQIFSEPDVSTPFHENVRACIKPFWGMLFSALELPSWLLSGGSGSHKTPTHASNGSVSSLPERKTCNANNGTQEWLRAGGTAKTSRFQGIFLDVLRLLAIQKFITICLDDLQFADEESLDLLQMLVTARIPIVLIVTYRGEHLLKSSTRRILEKATKIVMEPLTDDDTATFVAATLHRPKEYCMPLAAVIQEKSQGVPFFVRELLDSSYRSRSIYYCWKCNMWEFNLERLFDNFSSPDAAKFSSNDFVARRWRELSVDCQTLLTWAAIIGQSFSFNLMKRIMSCDCSKVSPAGLIPPSSQDPVAGLQSAISSFVIMPTADEDRFKWAHDRYLAAAAVLCDNYHMSEMHYVVAKAYMKHDPYDVSRPHNILFEQARHVCKAVDAIKLREPRRAAFRDLLYQAAETARENGARAAALMYFKACLQLLQDNPWDDANEDVSYVETLMLLTRASEAYWHMNRFDEGANLLAQVAEYARDANDKAPAAMIRSRVFEQKGDTRTAFEYLKDALSDLGIELHQTSYDECDSELQRLIGLVQTKAKTLDLDDLDKNQIDRNTQSLGALFVELLSAAFWTDALLFYQATLSFVRVFLERGAFPQAGFGVLFLGNIMIYRFGLVKIGLEFGDIALRIFDAFSDETYAVARGLTLYASLLGHFRQDMTENIHQLNNALRLASIAGDKVLSLVTTGVVASYRIWASENLGEVEAFIASVAEEYPDWRDSMRGGAIVLAARQFVRAMQGKTHALTSADVMSDDDHYDEEYVKRLHLNASNSDRPMAIHNSYKIDLLYRFGYYKEALALGEQLVSELDGIWCMRQTYTSLFFYALTLAAILRDEPDHPERDDYLQKIAHFRARIEMVSHVNPVNYFMFLKMIDAQLADLNQDYGNVLRHHESAINHSVLHSLTLDEALALESYSDWLVRRGASRPAKGMIRDAISAYRRVGAFGKADHLSERYEFLLYGTTSLTAVDAGTQTDMNDVGHYNNRLDRITSHSVPQPSSDRTQEWLHPLPSSGAQMIKEPPSQLSGGLSAAGLDMIDLASILESSQLLSSELNVEKLLAKLTEIIVDSTGADLCGLVVEDDSGGWCVAAVGTPDGVVAPPNGIPLDDVEDPVAQQVALYVLRFKDQVYLRNVLEDERFANVPPEWLVKNPEGASMISLPILHGDNVLLGSLYVQAAPNTFTERTVTLLKLLVNQIAISIANALLFKQVDRVSARNASMIEVQKQALSQAREAEKKAKAAEAKAMEMVRLKEEAARAKSMFLAHVSHELRTPLNGVIGMSEMLKATPLNKEQEEHADSIRVCADTLLSVINDILDFSKLEAGKMTVFSIPLSLNQTISEVVRALSYTNLERQLETIEELDLPPELVVMGDPVRIHQILMNVLSNSYKFTSTGSVTVRAKVDSETADDITVTISIQDTGIGISQEAQKKLFLPFSQADSSTARSYGGTGLGLSICKAIIENVLRGKIWLESELGVGTTVSFSLPFKKSSQRPGSLSDGSSMHHSHHGADPMSIFKSPTGPTAAEINTLASVPRNELKVCIAEDNPINQKIAISFVKKLGFSCEAFSDGKQAVDALGRASAASKPFHLVLMDVQMPVMDGYDATREIRKHSDPAVRDVLVIAMTASAIRGDREKCLEAGMNNYLAKPVRADTLKQMLESYLHQPEQAMPNLQEEANHLVNSVEAAEAQNERESATAATDAAANHHWKERTRAPLAGDVPERPRSARNNHTAFRLQPEEMAKKKKQAR